ncbi:AsmA family protein [Luteibacter flocculans]|uniref:AsmA family protein n=1 Tax=Luteibacter flocculans TaxID=2780091 RepID=A0ABY4T5I0_9GAMM|nr:AsmA family protein [Luteibacter flocculans]URL60005.1 AsmA family protein [Luteibacter flocculans]
MRRGRKIVAWLVGILVLLIVAVVLFIAFFDWNRLKPTINEKVSEAIGRPFAIRGDLSAHWSREPGESGLVGWIPWPHFTARDISVSNPSWAKNPQFATLDTVEFRLSPFPLIAHRIVIPEVRLGQPNVALERTKNGDNTWTFKLPESTGPSEWQLELNAIAFDKGHIDLTDAMNRITMGIDVTPLGKGIPFDEIMAQQETDARAQAKRTTGASAKAMAKTDADEKDRQDTTKKQQVYYFAWDAKGTYKQATLSAKARTGGVLALRDADKPFPVQADARFGDTHIAFVGTLTDPLNMGALDVRLWFSGTSMSHLYDLTGVTLPDTPPFATEGHLRANLKKGASVYTYENFSGRVGGSDLGGSLVYDTRGARPKLSGSLKSNQLLFSDLAPLIGGGSDKEKAERGDAVAQPADKVLPVEPFKTDRWNAMDADVTFTGVKIVHGERLPIDNLSTHLIMQDAVLTLDPLKFGVAGGTVGSNIKLDGSRTPMKGGFNLGARHLKLKQLFPTFAPMQTSFGELNGDASLTATGNSPAALLGTLNGEVKLLIDDGAISSSLLELAGLNVGSYAVNKLFGDEVVKINCMAADLVSTNGIMDSRLFAFDTEKALINVTGNINFRDEKLDLDVVPHTKGFRIFSLRSPLYVHGTFKNPAPGVHAGPLILRGGGAVALAVFAAPVAALAALAVPESGQADATQCKPLLDDLRKAPPKANAK